MATAVPGILEVAPKDWKCRRSSFCSLMAPLASIKAALIPSRDGVETGEAKETSLDNLSAAHASCTRKSEEFGVVQV